MSHDIYLVKPRYESALLEELGGFAETLGPGVVKGRGLTLADSDLVFARQVLPACELFTEASVGLLAERAFERAAPLLDGKGPWALHAFAPDDPDMPWREASHGARAALISERFTLLMNERRRRTAREATTGESVRLLVQLLLVDRERLAVSVVEPTRLADGSMWPAPWPGGRVPIEEDKSAPSRAYRKLAEALAWSGATIEAHQRCVDLGAAPGGWTHVALLAGAKVVAVDRAPLEAPAAGHRALREVRGDAFQYEPEDPPVDWMFSDVIAEPEKSAALMERWLKEGWCSRFVVHQKFKGQGQYRLAFETLKELREVRPHVRAKQLVSDKNEVTFFG